jgi:hypothetical protein
MVLSLRERLVELWNPDDPLDGLWRLLASRYATALLLVCLALLVGIVILVPQRPAEVLSDPVANSRWLGSLSERFGGIANWLAGLRLVDVQHSAPLRIVLGLLAFNLLLALVDLLRPSHQVSRPLLALRAQGMGETGPKTAGFSQATLVATEERPGPAADLTQAVGQMLSAHGYRVVTPASGDWLYADRFAPFAAMLCLGLLLAITGLVVSERTAWWEDSVSLGPGQVRPLGHGTDLAIHADVVQADSVPGARFQTQITLLRDGQDIASGLLPDRFPALYDGLLFRAISTEPALLVQAEEDTGGSLPLQTPETGTTQFTQIALRFREQEPEQSPQYIVVLDLTRGRQVGRQFEQHANERYVLVPSRNLSLRLVHEPAPAQPARYRLEAYRGTETEPVEWHEFDAASSVQIDGDHYTFQPQRYAVIRFGQDYGLAVVLAGAVVTVLGLALSTWRPRRQVWAWSEEGEQMMLRLATPGKASGWLESLLTHIARQLDLDIQRPVASP